MYAIRSYYAEERLLRAIFGEKAREVRDNSLRVPHGEAGVIVDVKIFTRENCDELSPGVNMLVRCYIAQKRKISVGDKMAGRVITSYSIHYTKLYDSPQNFQLAPKEMGYLVCNIYFEDGRGRTGVHLNWFDEKDHSKYGEAGRVIDFNIYNNGKLIKSDRHDRDGILGIPCNGIYSGNKGIEIYNSKGEKTGQSEFRIPPVSGQDEASYNFV